MADRVMTIEEICAVVTPKKAAISAKTTERSMILKALGESNGGAKEYPSLREKAVIFYSHGDTSASLDR
ncbi:MAG: hypothetical protein LAO76_22370 [Acidobacteriia bacterium]|nr:hypothetical protein [Terriglobia bacterium]